MKTSELWMMAGFALLMAIAVLLGGCTSTQRNWVIDKVDGWAEYKPDKPNDPAPSVGWRSDLAEVKADSNSLKFKTRNLTIPTGNGLNKDGGFEWIITRVEGSGYGRLLIMVMGGNRPASRIYFDGNETNALWPMPMLEEANWEVVAKNGALRVILNGKEIWSRAGGYSVDKAIMNGYPNRHSTGEWFK
jgi:hypothetical protein